MLPNPPLAPSTFAYFSSLWSNRVHCRQFLNNSRLLFQGPLCFNSDKAHELGLDKGLHDVLGLGSSTMETPFVVGHRLQRKRSIKSPANQKCICKSRKLYGMQKLFMASRGCGALYPRVAVGCTKRLCWLHGPVQHCRINRPSHSKGLLRCCYGIEIRNWIVAHTGYITQSPSL